MAYVYKLSWTKFNMSYIGVRYGRASKVGDIWKTYFTSSRHVKAFRCIHGEPDLIEILGVYDTKETAIEAEENFIKKTNAVASPLFLNKHSHDRKFTNPGGWKHSEAWKRRQAERMRKVDWLHKFYTSRKGKTNSKLQKQSARNRRGYCHTQQAKEKMSKSKLTLGGKRVSVVNSRGEILEFPSLAQLAKFCNVSRNKPIRWLKNKRIPIRYDLQFVNIDPT